MESQRLFPSAPVLLLLFISIWKFANANVWPELGAAGVVANDYLPQGEAGQIGNNPAFFMERAVHCLSDRYIYSSCEESYRLKQSGELDVPNEDTEQYCNGPCLSETKHVLDCINSIFHEFLFYNKATLNDVRRTIDSACAYGPLRGNFNVGERVVVNYQTNGVAGTLSYVVLTIVLIGPAALL